MQLDELVSDFAASVARIDARRPQAKSARGETLYQAGIGPHPETATVRLVSDELRVLRPAQYTNRIAISVPYPETARQKCDLCIGQTGEWDWAIEVKMLRLMGDNGQPNDNMLMHILSPYPSHRSALTDCRKLAGSSLADRSAVLIYGFDYPKLPMDPAIEAFELLASAAVELGERVEARYTDLVHPIHREGRVFAWEVGRSR